MMKPQEIKPLPFYMQQPGGTDRAPTLDEQIDSEMKRRGI